MNILVLTSVYRDESRNGLDTSTNIVNSFVKEWNKQGHNVIVVHNSHQYPRILYRIPSKIIDKIIKRQGFQILNYEDIKKKIYCDGAATIYRIPIKKMIPHRAPSTRRIKSQVVKIKNLLSKQNFEPDVIIGHWISPQAEIISRLKCYYNCKTALVLHGLGYVKDKKYNFKQYLEGIDKLGCRSNDQAIRIKESLDLEEIPFICYSGIPDEYVRKQQNNLDKFHNVKKWRFTYVGRLVDYKNVDVVIRALSKKTEFEWELNIIGSGPNEEALKKLARELNVENSVIFHGKVAREKVMNFLDETHCFVMVSTSEVFGLVYLEAMAAGCITIASKDGGVDGIIKNNENGFLAKEADVRDLELLIDQINSLPEDELVRIAKSGYDTSTRFTDSEIAKKYLLEIINI